MDNGAYSFFELRRNLQSSRPTSTVQAASKHTSLELRQHGISAFQPNGPNTPAGNNPPLRISNQEAQNRKPLFTMLYGSQQKSKPVSHVARGRSHKVGLTQKNGISEDFDDDRLSEASQPRLERLSSPGAVGAPPRSHISTPSGKDSVDDATRHVFNSYISLTERVKELKEKDECMQRAFEGAVRERDVARAEAEDLKAQVQKEVAQLSELRRAITSYESRLAASHMQAEEADHSMGKAQDTIVSLTSQLKEERRAKDRIQADKEHLKSSLQAIRSSAEERASAYRDLQERYQTLMAQVQSFKSLAKDVRSSASEALEANKALLESDGLLTTGRECRIIIGELQAQLESSKEVTTILRDKLHHLASVVVESKGRIAELEEEKKSSLARLHEDYEDLKSRSEHSVTLQKKVEELTDRLVVREMETFEYLATAVATEERLEAANTEVERLKGIIAQSTEELVSLRAVREDHLNKLMAAQEVTNAKDKELSVAKSELKSTQESKAELRALWLETKTAVAEKDKELLRRNPNPELEAQVQELTTQMESAKKDFHDVQGQYSEAIAKRNAATKEIEVLRARCKELERAAESHTLSIEEIKQTYKIAHDIRLQERTKADETQSRYAELQENEAKVRAANEELFKQQLKVLETKLETLVTQCETEKGNLIERHEEQARLKDALHREREAAYAANIAKLEKEIKGLADSAASKTQDATKYQVEIANCKAIIRELDSEKRNLQSSMDLLKQEQTQLLAMVAEEKDRQKGTIDSQVRAQMKLSEAQEQRALSAQAAMEIWQKEAQRYQVEVEELTNQLSQLRVDLEEQKKVSMHKDELLVLLRPSDEDLDVRAQIEVLTAENARLKDDAARLIERYGEGNLTEVEKAMVRHVLAVAESVNEEDLVQKDIEIKTRDNQLQIMQQRIRGLEKTLAQLLRNQAESAGSANLNMVNLQSRIFPSPKDQLLAEPARETIPDTQVGRPSAILMVAEQQTSPAFRRGRQDNEGPSLAKLMESSDDDTPLAKTAATMSDLSERSETKKKRARMSSPPPPSAQSKRKMKNPPNTKRGARAAAGPATDKKNSEEVGRSRALKRK